MTLLRDGGNELNLRRIELLCLGRQNARILSSEPEPSARAPAS